MGRRGRWRSRRMRRKLEKARKEKKRPTDRQQKEEGYIVTELLTHTSTCAHAHTHTTYRVLKVRCCDRH